MRYTVYSFVDGRYVATDWTMVPRHDMITRKGRYARGTEL